MHYYKFHIGDYRKDTVHLTPIEHYIYRSLIDWCYLDEAGIPKETQVVLRRLQLGTENKTNLKNVLSDFFEEHENEWVHLRINREYATYQSQSERNKENGKKGGRPKKQRLSEIQKPKETQVVSSGNPNETATGLTINHKPLTINQKRKKKKEKRNQIPPELCDIENYIFEMGFGIKANDFFDYHTARGWVVGKSKMKDWQAAVRTFERNRINWAKDGLKQSMSAADLSAATDWHKEDLGL